MSLKATTEQNLRLKLSGWFFTILFLLMKRHWMGGIKSEIKSGKGSKIKKQREFFLNNEIQNERLSILNPENSRDIFQLSSLRGDLICFENNPNFKEEEIDLQNLKNIQNTNDYQDESVEFMLYPTSN